MWRPVRRRFALLALLACLPLAPGGAAEAAAVPLRVCYNEQLGPADGSHFSLVMLRSIAARFPELEVQTKPLPWVRCLAMAGRGEVDAVLGASYTEERGILLVYPRREDGEADEARRLFDQGYRVLRRSGSALRWDGTRFLELDGPIGVERGYSAVQIARAAGASVDENHPDALAMLAKLRAGRLAGALIGEPLYASLKAQPGALEGLEAVDPPFQTRAYYLVFSSGFAARHARLASRLWRAGARERESPAIQALMAEQQGRSMTR